MSSRDITVGATSVNVASRNYLRKYMLFVNKSVNNIFISFGQPATTGDTPLYGQGASWELTDTMLKAAGANHRNMDEPLFLEVHAIASGAGSVLHIVEVS